MTTRDDRRDSLIERLADYVLVEGLAGATLRPMAAGIGTSDRMLLYYFADKDELLTVVLERIAARLLAQLDEAIPVGTLRAFETLLHQVWTVLGSDRLQPYRLVWLDMIGSAARGMQPHRSVAGAIADGYLVWVSDRLASDGSGSPALFLAIVEGLYMLDALGRPEIARRVMIELSSGTGPWSVSDT